MIHNSLRSFLLFAMTFLVTVPLAGVAPAETAPPPGKAIITELPPAASAGSAAAPAREGEVTPETPYEWDGPIAVGENNDFDAASATPCNPPPTPTGTCDVTLINVNVPPTYWTDVGGGVQVSIFDYTVASSDFDLYVYQSNADGSVRGPLVGSSAGFVGEEESTTIPQASGYYLVYVVYWAVPVASGYSGIAQFSTRYKIPLDVDTPPGLQETLASDPSQGWKSHSEMHVAQNPLDRNMLIAGSKFYNKDRDSLPEYEFKIGTYVSFDGGQTWTSLGQVNTCPQAQAGPETWPEDNTCYPADDPAVGGTGPEDADDPDEDADPVDDRGSTDYGEEYLVSDPWVQFDDEGNAYLMVLDSPPYEDGLGWGMSFHRWETPSPADVASGNTWSNRIIINAYPDEGGTEGFLDDKNTFAVNNAGPDRDGQIGIMVACWGQNINLAVKQQTVCERSTDGGKTWPDEPEPISPPSQQLVIGVNVVADTVDPNTFYAMWNHYAPEIAGQPSEMWFARSTNGGQSWSNPVRADQFRGIPTQYPNQNFRNLSIPIMAVGKAPAEGESPPLYAVYSEYRAAPTPATDEDGMQADTVMIKSTNAGASWSAPVVVNQDGTNADQFQPYIAVTDSGQLNVIHFDRRLDFRAPTGTPPTDTDNYFTDLWLSRSNDGGTTWTDHRITHDATDPELNAPVSGSGLFFGDYQGLVVDDCAAIPFVNDTHLANDSVLDPGPIRDPNFDTHIRGLPAAAQANLQYQQALSWRVPNTSAFGGPNAALPSGCLPTHGDPPPEVPPAPCPRNLKGNVVVGTNDRDVLIGTKGRDILCGGQKNDNLRARAGNDLLIGGNGKDILRGGPGNDTMRGGPSNDILAGGAGKDHLRGGGGRDTLRGGAKKDKCVGGGGKDRVRAC